MDVRRKSKMSLARSINSFGDQPDQRCKLTKNHTDLSILLLFVWRKDFEGAQIHLGLGHKQGRLDPL